MSMPHSVWVLVLPIAQDVVHISPYYLTTTIRIVVVVGTDTILNSVPMLPQLVVNVTSVTHVPQY